MGHSFGGCLALLYALQYTQRVSHLLLVGTTAAWDYFDEMAEDLQRRAVGEEVTAALLNLPSKTVWNAAANVRSRQLTGGVRRRLGEITAPTLILTGREDFFCQPTQAEGMHRSIPGSEMGIFERSSH